jgi:hypothetical protein
MTRQTGRKAGYKGLPISTRWDTMKCRDRYITLRLHQFVTVLSLLVLLVQRTNTDSEGAAVDRYLHPYAYARGGMMAARWGYVGGASWLVIVLALGFLFFILIVVCAKKDSWVCVCGRGRGRGSGRVGVGMCIITH